MIQTIYRSSLTALVSLFVLLTFTDLSSAETTNFPEAFFPTSDHPRLWLSAERLAAIESAKNQNVDQWQAFKSICDAIIDDDPVNDPWNLNHSPQNYTAWIALMYRLTKETRYADAAMDLMDNVSLDFSVYAEPDHESWHFLGLAYDWLYDYAGFTETKKKQYQSKMISISEQLWNECNLNESGTDSDRNLLTGMEHLTMGAALYGDVEGAITLLDRGWKGWVDGYYTVSGTSNRDLIESALGGVYFSGMAYLPSTDITGISGYQLTLATACNYDLNIQEPELKPFWPNVILSMVHLTEPTRERIYPYSSWQDPNILATQAWLRRAVTIATHFAEKSDYSTQASLGRGYALEVDIGYTSDEFAQLFYYSPSSSVVSPYNTGQVSLVRFADEPDFLLFRNSWNTEANFGVFRGNGSIPFDHQAPDHGHFSLWRGDGYLTQGARNYESMMNGDFFNTLSIENGCSINDIPCSGTAIFDSEKKAQISRHREQESGPLFVYGMLEADGQWNDKGSVYQADANVKTYRRHFFWAEDYSIVFDRLRTKTAGWSKYRLRAMTEPIVTGTTVSQLSTNGKHKLLQQTLEPSGITIDKIDESVLWADLDDWIINSSERLWQTVIDLPVSTSVNVLNVIQTGPATMTDFDALEHLSGSDFSGVRLGKWVVIFAPEEKLRSNLSYTVHNSVSGMWHVVADLDPGIYNVYQNDQLCATVTVAASDNTALFQTQKTELSLGIRVESVGDVVMHDSKITDLDVSGIPSTTSVSTFKVKAEADSGTMSYRYSIHPDYGTSGYDGKHWSLMRSTEWTTDNILSYTFPSTGKYIIVVWATTADTSQSVDSTGIPIVGWSVDVSGTGCQTNFSNLTITGNQKVNQQMTFTVNANNSCEETLNYRFSIHPDYGTSNYDGTNWQLMTETEWVTTNSINHTFTQAGKYIVVVWVSDHTENVGSTGIPIIGWSVDIE